MDCQHDARQRQLVRVPVKQAAKNSGRVPVLALAKGAFHNCNHWTRSVIHVCRAEIEGVEAQPFLPMPEPSGTYAEAMQTGNLLFLSGMLPTEGRGAKFVGRVGAELDVEAGRNAARVTAMNALVVACQHLDSLDRVKRIVCLGVLVATSGHVRDQPEVAEGASISCKMFLGKIRRFPYIGE